MPEHIIEIMKRNPEKKIEEKVHISKYNEQIGFKTRFF